MIYHQPMVFTDFGNKLSQHSGILQLMDDIAKPLPAGVTPHPLGGGNPARVPEVERAYREELERILADGDRFEDVLAHYDSPQGRVEFLEMAAEFFRSRYGWPLTMENIALTNGSQSAMFYLFNLFSGTCEGKKRTLLFPLMPEYIGYADQGIEEGTFVSIPSIVEYSDDRTFKYRMDLKSVDGYLASHPEVGAMCVSRPTNPSGNVLTDDEIHGLSSLAHKYAILLIVDNAYGLPSIRTGIVIARKEIISAVGNMNAIAALATGSMGPVLAGDLLSSGKLTDLASNVVRPFYEKRAMAAVSWIRKYFDGTEFFIHRPEGSIFLWLYLPSLSIPTLAFYSVLMKEGVVTVPGEYFFFGSDDVRKHPHYDKCLRINYSGDPSLTEDGIRIIAEKYREYSV